MIISTKPLSTLKCQKDKKPQMWLSREKIYYTVLVPTVVAKEAYTGLAGFTPFTSGR